MRIAFLGPAHPIRGGIAQFIAILAQRLQKRGHEVKVFSFHRQYPKILFPGKEQVDHSKKRIELDIQAVVTPYNPLTWPSALRQIKRWKPDVLIMKYWIPFFAPMYAWMVRKLKKHTGIRTIFVIDNIEFHEKWIAGDTLTRLALGKADNLITMSDAVYRSVDKVLPGFPAHKVVPLFHPNYDYYTEPVTRETAKAHFHLGEGPVILFFGYIKRYKGLDILLDAVPEIREQIPDIQLLIAGEVYGDPGEYEEKIASLGDCVNFQNRFINNEEVPYFFNASDVVVLPYRSATQSGITQLAFAFDKPVVATDVGGLSEVIHDGKNGFLVEAENTSAVAEGVVRFFKENRGEAFANEIRMEKAKYDWEPFVDEVEKLL